MQFPKIDLRKIRLPKLSGISQKLAALKLALTKKPALPKIDLRKTWLELKAMQPREVADRVRDFLFRAEYHGRKIVLAGIALLAFVFADTVALLIEGFVPDPPAVPAPIKYVEARRATPQERYKDVIARNIFNSSGTIPDDGFSSGLAVKTRLPFTLIGTVILEDPSKSIATIDDKSLNRTFPVQVGDRILDKAQIEKIEDFKVIFTNLGSGALEYVDMPQKNVPEVLEFQPSRMSAVKKGQGISQTGENQFEVERSTIDKSVANLGEVLQQARAIPHFENGQMTGYKILQIVPGSIYEQLGLKNGDVLGGINGQPVSDPGRAMQMLNNLKNESSISLSVRRNGSQMNLNYNLR